MTRTTKRFAVVGAIVTLALSVWMGIGGSDPSNKPGRPPRIVNLTPPAPAMAQDALDRAAEATGGVATGAQVPVDFEALGRQLGLSPAEAKAFAERSAKVAAAQNPSQTLPPK